MKRKRIQFKDDFVSWIGYRGLVKEYFEAYIEAKPLKENVLANIPRLEICLKNLKFLFLVGDRRKSFK